jgi:hypothetical protein
MVTEFNHKAHKAHKGRTNGDDCCSEANRLFFSSAVIRQISRLCELCVSAVNNRSQKIKKRLAAE